MNSVAVNAIGDVTKAMEQAAQSGRKSVLVQIARAQKLLPGGRR